MTRVLVTGASGLLGRRVATVLEQAGAEVVRTSLSGALGGVAADLRRPEAAAELVGQARPQVVLHLAGGQAPDSDALYGGNVLATVHLLEAVGRTVPTAYVLVCGSAAEYGDGPGRSLAESAACAPVTGYGRAKLAQTELARVLAARHGFPLLVLRPFNLVASDLPATSALGNIRAQLLTGDGQVRCGRTDVRRDFVSADAVAAVVARLVEQRPDVPTVNLCSGVPVQLGALVAAAAKRLGVQVQLRVDPALAAIPAADCVVGDPAVLAGLGHRLDAAMDTLVPALLGEDGP